MKELSLFFLICASCLLNSAYGQIGATAFYSNDLSQKDIFKLIEDRKKWRDKADELERLLDKVEVKDPTSEAEKQALRRANSRLYEEKTKIEGLLIMTAQNLERAKNDLAREETAREIDQQKLKKASEKVEDLKAIVLGQKSLLNKLESKLEGLQRVVKELERQLFKSEALLRQAKLQVFKGETDVLLVTHKRKHLKTSFKVNNNVLPLCRFKRTKKLYMRTGIFLDSDEYRQYSKKKPKAEFFLYKLGSSREIASEKFFLEFSASSLPPLLTVSSGEANFTDEAGRLFWGIAEMDLSSKSKGIEKGDYYYILDIEGRYILTGNLSFN
jgi:hypothetical protein